MTPVLMIYIYVIILLKFAYDLNTDNVHPIHYVKLYFITIGDRKG